MQRSSEAQTLLSYICKVKMSYSQLSRALSLLVKMSMRLNSIFTDVAALCSALRLALGCRMR